MKKMLTLLAFAGVTSVASAQQFTVTEVDVIEVQDKYQVVTNRFWDNWFLSVGGGASVLFGHDDNAGKFSDRISPTLNIALGKWFTPGLGLRLQYSGLQAKGFAYDPSLPYVTGGKLDGGYYKQKFNYMNFHGDVMFNLNALFGGYNEKRVYEIIPYFGAGFTHSYDAPKREAFAVNAGIINRFRLSSALDLNLELSAMGVESKFDGEPVGKHDFDGVVSATLGLTYRFKARTFKRPAPQLISAAELRSMRQQMNNMEAANRRLQQELADAKNRPAQVIEETIVDASIAPRTVFFNIGSAEISPREAMNLKYLADRMQEFPDMTYTIYGYADSSTGSASFNKELSLKRAQSVANVLTAKYGIAANRLKVDSAGGVDKFGKPFYLNRVVLVESSK